MPPFVGGRNFATPTAMAFEPLSIHARAWWGRTGRWDYNMPPERPENRLHMPENPLDNDDSIGLQEIS